MNVSISVNSKPSKLALKFAALAVELNILADRRKLTSAALGVMRLVIVNGNFITQISMVSQQHRLGLPAGRCIWGADCFCTLKGD